MMAAKVIREQRVRQLFSVFNYDLYRTVIFEGGCIDSFVVLIGEGQLESVAKGYVGPGRGTRTRSLMQHIK